MNFNSSKFVVSVKHTRRGQDPQKYASFTRPGKHMSPRWASWYFILPEFLFSEAISSGKCVPAYLAGEAWSPPRNTGLIWSSGKKKKKITASPLFTAAPVQKWIPENGLIHLPVTPQSSTRLFASLLYTVAKTEASLTCLCLFETAPWRLWQWTGMIAKMCRGTSSLAKSQVTCVVSSYWIARIREMM